MAIGGDEMDEVAVQQLLCAPLSLAAELTQQASPSDLADDPLCHQIRQKLRMLRIVA